MIDETHQYMIEEGMLVWVCKRGVDAGMPIFFEFIEHTMKNEMTFALLKGADVLTVPQGALCVHRHMKSIPEAKRSMLVRMIAFIRPVDGSSTTDKSKDLTLGPQQGEHATFWEFVEAGWDIFATGNKRYPYMICFSDCVKETISQSQNEWKYQQIFGRPSPKL